MKITLEVHETAKRKPTEKDAVAWLVVAYHRSFREWQVRAYDLVAAEPEKRPLWFSPRSLPKPPPLRKRKGKP